MEIDDIDNISAISSFQYTGARKTTLVKWFIHDTLYREIIVPHPKNKILGSEFVRFKNFNYSLLVITKFGATLVSLPQPKLTPKFIYCDNLISDDDFKNNSNKINHQDDFIEFNIDFPFPISFYKSFINGLILIRDLEYLTEDSLANLSNDDMFFVLDDPFREGSFLNFLESSTNKLTLLGCSSNLFKNCFLIFLDSKNNIEIYKLKIWVEGSLDCRNNHKFLLEPIIFHEDKDYIELARESEKKTYECDTFEELCQNEESYFFIIFKKEKKHVDIFFSKENEVRVFYSYEEEDFTNISFDKKENIIQFDIDQDHFIRKPFLFPKYRGFKVPHGISFNVISTHVQRYFNILINITGVTLTDVFYYKILFSSLKQVFFDETETVVFGKFLLLLMHQCTGNLKLDIDYNIIYWKDSLKIFPIHVKWFNNLMILREELMLNVLENNACQELSLILLKCSTCLKMPENVQQYFYKASFSFVKDSDFNSNYLNQHKLYESINTFYNLAQFAEFQTDAYLKSNVSEPLDFLKRVYKCAVLIENNKEHVKINLMKSEEFLEISHLIKNIEDCTLGSKKTLPRIYKIAKLLESCINIKREDSTYKVLKVFEFDKDFLNTLPMGISSFIKKLAISYEEMLDSVNELTEDSISALYLRKDLKMTFESINKNKKEHRAALKFKINDANYLMASKILAFMLPLPNYSLFDNKINYADRDFVKVDCFLKQMCKPIGWGLIVYELNDSYVFSNEMKLNFDNINYSIVSIFDEKTVLVNDNYKNFVPLQFINKADFQTGITNAIQFPAILPGLDFVWVMSNKPNVLNSQYGGFLFGLGLQGYLQNLEEWQIYNILVKKYTPVSIGMFLGLTCSNKGSCNNLISKLLGIHLEQSLPSKSIDLNHHYTLQIASVLSFGMLYLESGNVKISSLMQECLLGKVAINGTYRYNESYTIAAGISIGLINLKTNDNGNNNLSDAALLDWLFSVINYKSTEFLTGPLMAICFMFMKSENIEVVNSLDNIFEIHKETYDLQITFYYNLVRSLIMWNEINENWIDKVIREFQMSLKQYENPFHLKLIPIYYEMTGCLMAYSIKNVGMRSQKLKLFCLCLIDRMLTMIKLDVIVSYNLQLFLKHILKICNMLIETISLNFCSSGDLEILKRCKFILTEETTNIMENYNKCFEKPEHLFSESSNEELCSDILNKNFYNRSTDYATVLGNLTDNDAQNFEDSSSEEEDINDLNDLEDGMDDADEQRENGNNESDKNADYIEKIGHLSEKYALYSSSSFSMGLLLLGGGKKMINISSKQNLAFLILSMIPASNQFPFELQELKHMYLMAAETKYLVVKDCNTKEIVNVEIICHIQNNDIDAITMMAPTSLINLDLISFIEINSDEYYKLVINGNDLKRCNKEEIVIFVQPKNSVNNTKNASSHNSNVSFIKKNSSDDLQFKNMLLKEQTLNIKDWNLDLLTISKDHTTNCLDLWHSRK
ncbi:hypothetical protein QEN19_004270 [Hanseniaspora menglaensis]